MSLCRPNVALNIQKSINAAKTAQTVGGELWATHTPSFPHDVENPVEISRGDSKTSILPHICRRYSAICTAVENSGKSAEKFLHICGKIQK